MNISKIRQDAAHLLQQDRRHFRKPVLIHSAVTVGLSLLLVLIPLFSKYIISGDSLDTMDTKILLSTTQVLLQLAIIAATPFWNAGLIFCALKQIRGQAHSPTSLTEGFLRWGPMISSIFIRSAIYFIISLIGSAICGILVSFLPVPASLAEELNALAKDPALVPSSGIQALAAVYLFIYFACICILLVPKRYLYRLVEYQIMDEEPCGGLQALMHSSALMKGRRRKLFLLDLSFWWFYLLELVISVLSLAEYILPGLGITIPYADCIFPITSLLLLLALYYFAKPKLAVSYALFYQQTLETQINTEHTPNQGNP